MTRFATGLVVGKLCPLHRGHELVIETALGRSDQVLVISWAKPEPPGMSASRRARWLEALFPETRRLVLDDAALALLNPPPAFATLPADGGDPVVDRRLTAWLCERAFGARPDAVFSSEAYGAPFAEELSRVFGKPVASVLVDPERRSVPISGTLLRADIHAGRSFLSPEVYRDFVERVVLLGAESSGKSTLAEHLAEQMGTLFVPEYGRELWERKHGALVYEDLLAIGREQVAREEAALGHANRWLMCDTSPLTTLFYSHALFGRAEPELEALAERRYDATALCLPEFPLVQDGTRQDEAFRQKGHAFYLDELARRGIAYVELSGTPEARARALRLTLESAARTPC